MDLDRSLQDVAEGYRPDRQPPLDELVTKARARRRTTAPVAVTTVAVLGVGIAFAVDRQPEHVSVTAEPTPTTTFPPVVHACGEVKINGIADYINFVKVRDTVLTQGVGGEVPGTVRQADLGEATERVTCSLEAETHGTGSSNPKDIDSGTSSFLPEGTPIYVVDGFDTRCRVAAEFNGKLTSYVALDPDARIATPAPCAIMPGLPPNGPATEAGDYRSAPLAYRHRAVYDDCGSINRMTMGAALSAGGREARDCLLDTLDSDGTAEVRQVQPTIDSGPMFEVIRVKHGVIEQWMSGYTGQGKNGPYWRHENCTGIDRTTFHTTGCTEG